MIKNIVVIYSGRFQPFHKGHYKTYLDIGKKFGFKNLYIATSNKTDSDKSPFDFSEKKLIMTKMFDIPTNKILLNGVPSHNIIQVKNPYNPIEILSQFDPDTTAYITVVGEKDSQRLGGKYFLPLKSLKNLNSYKDNGYVYISPEDENAISGTDVRRWLSVNDDSEAKENFFKAYPKFDKAVFNLIRQKLKSMNENILLKISFDSELKQMILLSNPKTLKETFGWYDEKYFNRLTESIIHDIIENPQPNESDYIHKFTNFCKKYLQLDTHPEIELVNNSQFAEKNKTLGYYDLTNNTIKVCIKGRLLADIMRTIAHEMVHHKQRELGHKMDGSTGSKVENSANIIAAMLMRKFGEGHSKIFSEMNKPDIDDIENFADRNLAPYDFEFGKETDHFFQRINDPRNGKEITKPEMIGFFKRLIRNKKAFEYFTKKYSQFVISDKRTNINIPFMNMVNKLIAKTIMRKPSFASSNPVLQLESLDDVVYIEFMNKQKGFRKDRMDFKGKNAYKDAVEWGKKNIDNFKIDMIKFENDLYETIKKVGDKYVVYPKKGGNRLGTHDTLKGAKKQLAAIEINKESADESTNEDITLPVNIGDIVLMGKFKNKKVKVKDIGTDEHGMPTINGKKATTFRILPKKDLTEKIEDNLINKYGIELDLYERPDYIELSKIIVPKEMRSKGIGTKVMNDLINYATDNKQDIFLTPSDDFGGSKSRLIQFYKSLGFQPNVGKNRDFRSKESMKLSLSENILLEGGAYGHMAHPFDIEMNLTFADLKDIVSKALNGELELAREKTDGQALAVSWKDGKLIAARNKGHLANAGENALTANELISKFEGRGAVSDAFKFAIQDLENAISQLSDAQKESIFKNGKAFMNCEVIYPESANVIPYGQSLLVFHGTMDYDEKGNAISENPDSGDKLANMIKDINAEVQEKFSIQGPPVQQLPVNKNLKEKKPIYLQKINRLQSEFNLKDSDGVQDYHQAWWSKWIDENAPEQLTLDEKIGLIKRWAFDDKTFRLNTIKDPQVKAWADKTDKIDRQKINKQNLLKFEDVFLGVGADVLSFMTSVLAANPDKAKQKMISDLQTTIDMIKTSGDIKSLEKLELELTRLNKLGGFEKIVPNEGIVFSYKGNTYKLTGAFAPLNQILGIFKYSR